MKTLIYTEEISVALLSVSNLSLMFSDNHILKNLSFNIEPKDKVGLIGANGAGKTTLFKLITKELQADEGTISIGKNTVLGYMQQHACASSEITMLDELMSVFTYLYDIEDELEEIEKTNHPDNIDFEEKIERLNFLHFEYERLGGLTYKSRARSALLGLGFKETDFSLPCSALSGGQRSKVSLCKLLLCGANLLLLDEPTNHLDISSINWLEGWLSEFNGSFIVISHDRYFLDKITNRTFEIERTKLYSADRSYTGYLQLKEERRKAMERVYDNTMAEVNRIEGIIEQQKRFNRERNYITIASKQKSIDRLLDGLEKPDGELSSIKFKFNSSLTSGNDVLICQEVSKSFSSKPLFENASIHIKRGEKVFLVGDNGCGKSTLLKVILGKMSRDSGKVILGSAVKIGYFDQSLAELSSNKTVLDEVWDCYKMMPEKEVRSALAAFLFKGEDVFKNMSSLSGGEKGRVALLKLMLSGANFLVLDEPTNHLDIKSKEALEAAFDSYDGTLLCVSHDRYFINKLSTRILHLKQNQIDSYSGNYDYFSEQSALHNSDSEALKPAKPKENEYKLKKERESELRKLKGRISRLEAEIDEFDEKISQTQNEINDPSNTSDYEKILRLTEELNSLVSSQEERMELWQALCEELEEKSKANI